MHDKYIKPVDTSGNLHRAIRSFCFFYMHICMTWNWESSCLLTILLL